jgi:hypothetical protein
VSFVIEVASPAAAKIEEHAEFKEDIAENSPVTPTQSRRSSPEH